MATSISLSRHSPDHILLAHRWHLRTPRPATSRSGWSPLGPGAPALGGTGAVSLAPPHLTHIRVTLLSDSLVEMPLRALSRDAPGFFLGSLPTGPPPLAIHLSGDHPSLFGLWQGYAWLFMALGRDEKLDELTTRADLQTYRLTDLQSIEHTELQSLLSPYCRASTSKVTELVSHRACK